MHYVKSRFTQYAAKHRSTKQGLVKFEIPNTNENEVENELEICRLFDNQYLVSIN